MKHFAFSLWDSLLKGLAQFALVCLVVIAFFGSLYVSAKFQEARTLMEIRQEEQVSSPPPDPDPENQQPIILGASAVTLDVGYDRNLPLLF